MILPALFFYLFAFMCIASAFMVIASKNPVHSVLYLILAFVNASGLFVMMGAEFLAMILIVVYVGAVAVLFLFVVMMLDINLDRMREGFWANLPVALMVGAVVVGELALVIWSRFNRPMPAPEAAGAGPGNTQLLGEALYTDYIYPVEVAAVILLVAIIAAIALTLRRRKDSRYNDPSVAVRTRREDRVRLVSMPAERRADDSGQADSPDGAAPSSPRQG